MSKFIVKKFEYLRPYSIGEQPTDKKYIHLNANESPFSVSKNVMDEFKKISLSLEQYPNAEYALIREKIANTFKLNKENVLMTNGVNEALNFSFLAYSSSESPIVFSSITYGMYKVLCELNGIKCEELEADEDYQVPVSKYKGIFKTIVISNPNDPTGTILKGDEIREILESNPDNIVIVDETYSDYADESVTKYIKEFDNLIVIKSFSVSMNLAGINLGFILANENLIDDINTIRLSMNPYNVNSMSIAMGMIALDEYKTYMDSCKKIARTRERIKKELTSRGFYCLDSSANFLLIKKKKYKGDELYRKLKMKGILVRKMEQKELKDFIRVSIGNDRDMDIFLQSILSIVQD